jgi:hypothetical protein
VSDGVYHRQSNGMDAANAVPELNCDGGFLTETVAVLRAAAAAHDLILGRFALD